MEEQKPSKQEIKEKLKDMHKAKKGKEIEAYLNSLPVTRKEFLELKDQVKMLHLNFKSTDSVGERPSEDTLWAEIISSARSYDGTPKDLISLTEYYKRFYSVTRNK